MKKFFALLFIITFIFSCNNTTENKTSVKDEIITKEEFLNNLENPINTLVKSFDSLDALVLSKESNNLKKMVTQIQNQLDSIQNKFDTMYVPQDDSAIYIAAQNELRTMNNILDRYKKISSLIEQTPTDTLLMFEIFTKAEDLLYTADSLFTEEFSKYTKKHKILRH